MIPLRNAVASFAGLLMAAFLLAGCTTAGTPVAQRTTPSLSSGAASTPPPAIAAPQPTPPSDEDQVREVVQAFQDAYNTQNWDAYVQQMCPSMRERFNGLVMEMVKKGRADTGMTRATVTAVSIDGDTATATLDSQNEARGSRTVTMPLVRDDGWKICMQY